MNVAKFFKILFLFGMCLNQMLFAQKTSLALDQSGVLSPIQIGSPEKIFNQSDNPAVNEPLVRSIYMVSPTILALTIHAQAVVPGIIKPFQKLDSDKVTLSGYTIPSALAEATLVSKYTSDELKNNSQTKIFPIVSRNNNPLGYILGPKQNYIYPFDQLMGVALDENWATLPSSYNISSITDKNYWPAANPIQVWHKTKPFRRATLANDSWGLRKYSHVYQIYLQLKTPLVHNQTYNIQFTSLPNNVGTQLSSLSFRYEPLKMISEAIQVNQHGYQLQSPKIAYLSSWMGDGGALEYKDVHAFYVVSDTGEIVFEGKPTLRAKNGEAEFTQKAGDGELRPISNSLTFVYELDFTKFNKLGRYAIYIPEIGISMPFIMDKTRWESALLTSMKGYYHQRASLEIGPPYSNYFRPRNFHPADGVKTYVCDDSLFYKKTTETGWAQTNIFKRIQNSIQLDKPVKNVIGGWHDAADFDRNIYIQPHLWPVNVMLDLYCMKPSYYETLNLNIPESTNNIPDIIDEALWCTDLFLNLQRPDGGIPSAIENIEHPKMGETSWLNSLPNALTPPSIEANLHFAGTAARLAILLQKYKPQKALQYKNAALIAIKWVENNPNSPIIYLTNPSYLNALKNFTYAALFELTQDNKWELAAAATLPTKINRPWRELGGLFLLASSTKLNNSELKNKAKKVIVDYADKLVERAKLTATYSLVDDDYARQLAHGFNPFGPGYAAFLTNDIKYIETIAKSAHYMMGANPMNISFKKGIGSRQVKPHHKDATFRGLDVPDGIDVYGSPSNMKVTKDGASKLYSAGIYPVLSKWPGTECYFDDIAPEINEYTVSESMASAIFAYGVLSISYTKP